MAVEPRFDPEVCAVCGSDDRDVVFDRRGSALTSDGRIVADDLVKLQCRGCGAVRRGTAFEADEQARHYGADYQLAGRAAMHEPVFFSESGAVTRSDAIFDWFRRALQSLAVDAPAAFLEVGAGEGRLLARFARHWPDAAATGLDLGYEGSRDGVEVRRGSYVAVSGRFDLVYAFAVIEHVSSPRHFLSVLAEALTDRGLLVVALPRLDAGSRELLFVDHLHHLQASHVMRLAEAAGLHEVARSTGRAHLADFALHVFAPGPGQARPPVSRAPAVAAEDVRHAFEMWQQRFAAVDRWLAVHAGRRLAVWGLGEAFGVLTAYSDLGGRAIDAGFDDNPDRFATAEFPFPISRFEAAAIPRPDTVVLLTFTPPPSVVARLEARGLTWFDGISTKGCPC